MEYEMVLGNGEKIIASPTQNQDLFYSTACSYGSLGIITMVKLRLVPSKDFVQLTYYNVKSFDEVVNLIENKTKGTSDFVDGIIFSKKHGVVMTGNLTNKVDLPVSTFRKRFDEWFYLHAKKISKQHDTYEEIIPIEDYLFRYDRGGFWVGRYAFTYLKIPYIKLLRNLLDRAFKARIIYRLLHATNISQRYFVQDFNLPQENVLNFLEYVDKKLRVYPLWLCPIRPDKNVKFSPNYIDTKLVINVGVWGEVNDSYNNFIQINRDVENKVAELCGKKTLYAHAYYSRSEFWKIYDEASYQVLREKYFADSVFPDIYDKTKVMERYKTSIIVGIWNALRSKKLPVS